MATQKLNISELFSEAKEIAKTHFRPYLALPLLFIFPLSISIVSYPTLQHSLAPQETKSHLQFPFNGDPIVFKPLGLFFAYLFTLFCLSVCAIGTVTYSLYHGFFGQPYGIKSLSNSLMRLLATFICAQAIILPGLVVIRLIVFGVTRAIEYLGFEIQYDSVCFRVFGVLGWVLLSLGVLYMYVDWVLAPAVVVFKSSWGLEPLRRSAYLVKGNRGAVVRLFASICGMTYLYVIGFGNWGQIIPFGSLIVVMMGLGSYVLSTHLQHCLITIAILYMKCKALQGELSEKIINQKYISLPLDEEKIPSVV